MTKGFRPIELIWLEDRVVPIPLVGGVNLHIHLSGFLVTRYYFPKSIRENLGPITGGTLRQIAYDLKATLDWLEFNNINYLEADFTNHLARVLDEQLGKANPETFNTRYSRVRDFYEYLNKQGIRTKATFPSKSIQKRHQNLNDQFLSHSSHQVYKTYNKDDGHKKTTLKEDYKDQVISIKTYEKLYLALKEIDVVYAVIAQVMMQTFLRVGDVCEIPLHSNQFNKYLPIWPEFERSGNELLRYECLTKGMKRISIDIYPETLCTIFQDYIAPCFKKRKTLFETVYMHRKNATLEYGNIRDKGRRSCPNDILWLTSTGAPVKPYMIEQAFRATGLGINPHMMRHTGATHTLWNYCRIYGIEPDERLASTFQQILQRQLGHADIETTKMYIRTLLILKGRKTMPFIIPGNQKEIDSRLAKKIQIDIKDQMSRFFVYRSEKTDAEAIE